MSDPTHKVAVEHQTRCPRKLSASSADSKSAGAPNLRYRIARGSGGLFLQICNEFGKDRWRRRSGILELAKATARFRPEDGGGCGYAATRRLLHRLSYFGVGFHPRSEHILPEVFLVRLFCDAHVQGYVDRLN